MSAKQTVGLVAITFTKSPDSRQPVQVDISIEVGEGPSFRLDIPMTSDQFTHLLAASNSNLPVLVTEYE